MLPCTCLCLCTHISRWHVTVCGWSELFLEYKMRSQIESAEPEVISVSTPTHHNIAPLPWDPQPQTLTAGFHWTFSYCSYWFLNYHSGAIYIIAASNTCQKRRKKIFIHNRNLTENEALDIFRVQRTEGRQVTSAWHTLPHAQGLTLSNLSLFF